MKRLTEKNEFGDYVGSNLLDDECLCRELSFDEMNEMTECFNKLGKLEDLEEELGIDLVTLFKALKNGIWIYDDGNPYFTSRIKLSWHLDAIYCDTSDIYVLLKDYGKTWALTKEELE